MNCVSVFWKVWGQQRANELFGSCLKEMTSADEWGCLYHQHWLIYVINLYNLSFAWGKVQTE